MKKNIIVTACAFGVCLLFLSVWLKEQSTDGVSPEESTVADFGHHDLPRVDLEEKDYGRVEKVEIPDLPEVENVESLEKTSDTSVLVRMPAGYQPDQFSLNRQNVMSAESIKQAVGIVTSETEASVAERFRAVDRLYGTELPKSEASRLLDYLEDENRYSGMNRNEMYSYINGIVAVFHDKPNLSDEFLKTSFSVIENSNEKEVIRDYVLQGLSRGLVNATPDQALQIREVFWQNVDEVGSSLAGTALLALNREYKNGYLDDEEQERFWKTTEQFLNDESVGERTRIPIIQIAADGEGGKFSDHFVRIVESSTSTMSEKIAALSALSKKDAPGAEEILFKASQSDEVPLARMASELIKKNHF